MNCRKIFLLFGSTGVLGKAAVNYFIGRKYDHYYFFTRSELNFPVDAKNKTIIFVPDLTNEKFVAAAFEKVELENDALYFLFSTVGGYIGGQLISSTEYADFKKMIELNLGSSFLIAKHFAKLVGHSKGGSICFTSALSSFKPEANKAAYNISKNALNYLVQTLALEGGRINLRANAVAPFAIDSDANREWIKDISKLVTPEDICKSAQSFYEDKTASGQIIALPKPL